METYESVLKRMQGRFAELSGFSADDASDIGIRLKVLAGEVYSLLCGTQWLKNQMFPQTASGESLDLHAGQRGLTRKNAVPASGSLTFGRAQPLPYDVPVPAGTVCSTTGEAGARFLTQEDAVLPAGGLSVTAAAKAQEGGRGTNAAPGTVTLMMTPPAGVETVTNEEAFSGGADAETDEELRQRLLQSYAVVPNGTNGEFYRDYVMKFEGIQSVGVLPRANGSGTVAVYAAAKGGAPAPELIDKIREELNRLREINVDVTVSAPEIVKVPVSLYLSPASGFTFQAARDRAEQAVREYFDGLPVGGPVVLAAIGKRVMDTGAVHNCHFETSISTDRKLQVSQLAVPGDILIEELGGAA